MTVDVTNRFAAFGIADAAGSPTIDVTVPLGVEPDDCLVLWAVGSFQDVAQVPNNVRAEGAGVDPDQHVVGTGDAEFIVGPPTTGVAAGLFVALGVTPGGVITVRCGTNPGNVPLIWSVCLLIVKGVDPADPVFDDNESQVDFGTVADPSVVTTPTILRPTVDGGIFLHCMGAVFTSEPGLLGKQPPGFDNTNALGTVGGLNSLTRTMISFLGATNDSGALVSGGIAKDPAFLFTPQAVATAISLNPVVRGGAVFLGSDGAVRNGAP